MPEEGCILWSDNMVIPVGAPNPTAAYEWMNYVYEPEKQAQIADYNYYLTPVDGVQEDLGEAGTRPQPSPSSSSRRTSSRGLHDAAQPAARTPPRRSSRSSRT